MKFRYCLLASLLVATALPATPALAQSAEEEAAWPTAWFEVFRLAPGKHEEFVRFIAMADEVSAAGGQPPIQLFFHIDGDDFDVIIYKPVIAPPTAQQQAAMDRRSRELGMPEGPANFVYLREMVASHTDSKVSGPISAAQWLERLDTWRGENSWHGAMPD